MTTSGTAPLLRLDPERALEGLDWSEVFGGPGRVDVEVGIGKGRFLLATAALRPDHRFLGIEWANEYLRIAEERAAKRGLTNVRFVRVDAKELVARAVPDASVTTYYVFYPDPWPKKRHHKRRFFDAKTADALARTLVPGGWLHAATDHEEYWSVLEPLLDRHEAFERLPAFGGPDFPLSSDEPLTNFEVKYAAEGRGRHRGSWRRRGQQPQGS
jgi:tRNA (guanine-N7-)-methyltransferase